MTKKINSLLLIGIIGTVVFGTQVAVYYGRAIWGNSDMWWTSKSLALSLDETKEQLRLFLGDELLQDHIDRRSLSVIKPNGRTYKVASSDIKIRLNNWQKIKASFLNISVYAAFMLGVSNTCFVLGVFKWIKEGKGNLE